jgi:hypothetical protein
MKTTITAIALILATTTAYAGNLTTIEKLEKEEARLEQKVENLNVKKHAAKDAGKENREDRIKDRQRKVRDNLKDVKHAIKKEELALRKANR